MISHLLCTQFDKTFMTFIAKSNYFKIIHYVKKEIKLNEFINF